MAEAQAITGDAAAKRERVHAGTTIEIADGIDTIALIEEVSIVARIPLKPVITLATIRVSLRALP